MTDQDGSYRPRSPDFSSFQQTYTPTVNLAYQPQSPYSLTSPASYDASPFFSQPYSREQIPPQSSRTPQPYISTYSQVPSTYSPDMPRRSTRTAAAAQAATFIPHMMVAQAPVPRSAPESTKPRPWDGIDVKTKFPVARIKRIMQADEDVGKVAQVTPIAVCELLHGPFPVAFYLLPLQREISFVCSSRLICFHRIAKALELFMISLVTKAAQEAKERNSKRITATHLKQAVAKDEVLDFLADIIAKVPDNAGRKHDDDGSDHNEGKRKTGGGRRKKDIDSDDF